MIIYHWEELVQASSEIILHVTLTVVPSEMGKCEINWEQVSGIHRKE